jgi:hypothetical protein
MDDQHRRRPRRKARRGAQQPVHRCRARDLDVASRCGSGEFRYQIVGCNRQEHDLRTELLEPRSLAEGFTFPGVERRQVDVRIQAQCAALEIDVGEYWINRERAEQGNPHRGVARWRKCPARGPNELHGRKRRIRCAEACEQYVRAGRVVRRHRDFSGTAQQPRVHWRATERGRDCMPKLSVRPAGPQRRHEVERGLGGQRVSALRKYCQKALARDRTRRCRMLPGNRGHRRRELCS